MTYFARCSDLQTMQGHYVQWSWSKEKDRRLVLRVILASSGIIQIQGAISSNTYYPNHRISATASFRHLEIPILYSYTANHFTTWIGHSPVTQPVDNSTSYARHWGQFIFKNRFNLIKLRSGCVYLYSCFQSPTNFILHTSSQRPRARILSYIRSLPLFRQPQRVPRAPLTPLIPQLQTPTPRALNTPIISNTTDP